MCPGVASTALHEPLATSGSAQWPWGTASPGALGILGLWDPAQPS